MHPLFKKADELSHVAVGAAIEVHRLKGTGFDRKHPRTMSDARTGLAQDRCGRLVDGVVRMILPGANREA
jgi:hypothetical protein